MEIEARGVSKTFTSAKALDAIDLRARDGELMALLGPSGSGKTTLLRIIAGLETPDENPATAILIGGRDVTGAGVAERGVGFVFQHYALFRQQTVFENIAFGLRVRPRAERPSSAQIRARVGELLELVQLAGLEKRYPSQLSGGQRQRVALARALAIEPTILLLDEPFGALDAKVRQELRRWLRRLHDEIHVTSIFVTHDQEEALEVADRVVIMNHGRIEQVGTPEEVFHDPASAFVMDFIGHVNLFHGRVNEGRAEFGPMVFDHADDGAGRDRAARLFVRPFDLELSRQPHEGPHLSARITRIQSAGPVVKVELCGAGDQPLQVDLSHARFRAEAFAVGDAVYVAPRDVRVFCEDYAI